MKKRLLVFVIVMTAVFTCSLALYACKDKKGGSVNVKEIKIARSFDASYGGDTYALGDKLNYSSAQIEVTNNDDTTVIIPVTEKMVSGFDTSAIGSFNLKISYGGKSAEAEYKVIECDPWSNFHYSVVDQNGNDVDNLGTPVTDYSRETNRVVIRRYIPVNNTNAVIPAELDGFKVYKIDDYAFVNTNLKSVVIPNGVTSIGNNAFTSSFDLESVSFPSALVSIGNEAFGYTKLSDFTIPAATAYIGEGAFRNIDVLTNPVIPQTVRNVGMGLFAGCENLASVTLPMTGLSITDTNTTIGQTIYGTSNSMLPESLTKVTISGKQKELGTGIFAGARHLANITVPQTIERSGGRNFNGTAWLRDYEGDYVIVAGHILEVFKGQGTAVVPAAITAISPYAFENNTKLTAVVAKDAKVSEIGIGAFSGCSALVSADFSGENLKVIKADAFNSCRKLNDIKLGTAVKEIERNAFYYTGFTQIAIPSSVKKIGEGILDNCYYLEEVALPFLGQDVNDDSRSFNYTTSITTVTSVKLTDAVIVPQNAFSGRNRLISVEINEGVTVLGQYAFSSCTGLEYAFLPDTVTAISDYAFANCVELKSIVKGSYPFSLGSNVAVIGEGAFSYALVNNISPFDLDLRNVTEINSRAFEGCTAIRSVTFGTGLREIGSMAFSSCDSLASVFFEEGLEIIGSSAFVDCPIEQLNLPKGLKEINNWAFESGVFTTVVIPESVEYIHSEIFGSSLHLVIFEGEQAPRTVSVPLGFSRDLRVIVPFEAYQDYCSALVDHQSVVFPDTIIDDNGLAIYNSTFVYYFGEGGAVVLPDYITEVMSYAFENSAITELRLPSTVNSIGRYILNGCDDIEVLSLPFIGEYQHSSARLNYLFDDETGITYTDEYNGTVPYSLKNITVTNAGNIAPYTFANTQLESTDITATGNLGAYAFSYCRVLETAYLQDITGIGDYAFINCDELTRLTVPDTVTSIGTGTLMNCIALKSLSVPFIGSSNYNANILEYFFADSYYSNTNAPNTLKTVTVTNAQSIISDAFANCYNITDIVLNEGITSIGLRIFNDCSSLVSITVPFIGTDTSTPRILGYYFNGSDNYNVPYTLKEVNVIGASSMAAGVFENTGLESISIPFIGYSKTGTQQKLGWLYNTTNTSVTSALHYVEITDASGIADNAFAQCSNIITVVLNEGLTAIGALAFEQCISINSIVIPYTVTAMGSSVFKDWGSTQTIKVQGFPSAPANWNNDWNTGCTANIIWAYQFLIYDSGSEEMVLSEVQGGYELYSYSGTSSWLTLQSDYNGKSLVGIGDAVFKNNYYLSRIIIPSSVKYIGKSAFEGCQYLYSVEITQPSALTEIGDRAFQGCYSLAWDDTINLNSLKSIGEYAFADCSNTSFNTFTIPSSVTSIGRNVFQGCGSLVNLTVPFIGSSVNDPQELSWLTGAIIYSIDSVTVTNAKAIANDAFRNWDCITRIVLNQQITSIGERAFSFCTALSRINVPTSLTKLGRQAFGYCDGLSSITLPVSLVNVEDSVFDRSGISKVILAGRAEIPQEWEDNNWMLGSHAKVVCELAPKD